MGFVGVHQFGDIHLTQGAIVNTSGSIGGAIVVHGREVQLTRGAQLFSVTHSSDGGEPLIVDASRQLTVSGFKDYNSALYTYSQGRGRAGDLRISTGQLTVRNGAGISSVTVGQGQSGDIRVKASNSVTVSGAVADASSNLYGSFSNLETQAANQGRAGNLYLTTHHLIIRDGGEVGSTTDSTKPGGDVFINASESVRIQGISTLPGIDDDRRGGNLLTQTMGTGNSAGRRLEI